jgi:hypothetical protein
VKTWRLRWAVMLLSIGLIIYIIHFLIWRDPEHILFWGMEDLAFAFIEVLLFTLIVHELLSQREKQSILEKLNMVIGAFFSEVGTELLKFFSDMDPQEDRISKQLRIDKEWTEKGFDETIHKIKNTEFEIEGKRGNLPALQTFLKEKRQFLLRLMENPNLLEHESFTEVLWAVFHLGEELSARKDIMAIPSTDLAHLEGDIKRAYGKLIQEWLSYMKHLKTNYPYLFSLALRTNPFDPNAHPEVTQ